jgi:hypothetical protein
MEIRRTTKRDSVHKGAMQVHIGQSIGCNRPARARMPQLLAGAVLLMFVYAAPCAALSTLLAESFENGGSVPSGWSIETVNPGDSITFITSTYLTGYTAYDGDYFVMFDSYSGYGGVMRLKKTGAISTGYRAVTVDFAWLESNWFPSAYDRVQVQWSTDGSTWNTAGTFRCYNAVQGWKIKTCALPVEAENYPALYIAFLFTADGGADCYIDLVHIKATNTSAAVTVADRYSTQHNTTLVIAAPGVLDNDTIAQGDTAILASSPTNGVAALNEDGSFIYIPVSGFSGTDNFTYIVSDGYNDSAPGKVTITVHAAATTTTTTIGGTTTTTTISGKPCPAKKALGENNLNLDNLRDFRDSRLANSAVGRKVIQIYYNNADSINAALERSPALRAVARRVFEVIATMVGKN